MALRAMVSALLVANRAPMRVFASLAVACKAMAWLAENSDFIGVLGANDPFPPLAGAF